MEERVVQWVLLRDWDYLKHCLGLPIVRRFAENLSTEHGIVDFVLQTSEPSVPLIIVELETTINSHGKLDMCIEQVIRYKRVLFPPHTASHIILYAADGTPERLARKLEEEGTRIGAVLRTYQLSRVERLHQQLLKQLKRTAGIPLGPTVAMDVCYLRWINKLIEPFVDAQTTQLPTGVFYRKGGPSIFKSPTSYGVYRRLATDFELITEADEDGRKVLSLTELGNRFARAYPPEGVLVGHAGIPELTAEQKRVLIESLTNGRMLPCKANIHYFLRFIHITEGVWVPKASAPEPSSSNDPAYHYGQLFTGLVGKEYKWGTLGEFLAFTCNQGEELGLLERLKGEHRYHEQVVLTSLGSRVYGFLELDAHLKREHIQIPLQVV